MKQEQLYEVLGDIDENYISEAHRDKKGSYAWVKWAAMAAGLDLFVSALIAIPQIIKPEPKEDPSAASHPSAVPLYVPAYSSPDLAELYREDPYSMLLPEKVPETWKFESSYKTEYDPIANPTGSNYLSLSFKSDRDNSNAEIKIVKYDDFILYSDASIADPAKPETYQISLYYDYMKNTSGAVGAEAPKVLNALFRAEDLTLPIVEKRIYVDENGFCNSGISVLCGEYIVEYVYSGMAISPETLFETITSSKYFSE